MLQPNVADNLILFQRVVKVIYWLNETWGNFLESDAKKAGVLGLGLVSIAPLCLTLSYDRT